MSEAGGKSFHFNSNNRFNSGSKASMANNEDRYLRALEIQERKREIRDEELERQKKLQELENPAPPATDENTEAQEEQPVAVEETAATEAEQSAPNAEEVPAAPEAPKPAPVVEASSGPKVPGPTPRKDFSSEEKAAMLKRARAHAAEVAKRKG
jgi:hypothetical protein